MVYFTRESTELKQSKTFFGRLVDQLKDCCFNCENNKSYDVQLNKDADINSKLRSIYDGRSMMVDGSYRTKIERRTRRECSPFLTGNKINIKVTAVENPESSILFVTESQSRNDSSSTIPVRHNNKQIYYL